MRGVVLAGGLGTRLLPMTKVTNKHLLPVAGLPMIYYPLKTLKSMGLENVLIVTGPEHCGDFIELLSDGNELGLDLTYKVQTEAKGIAHAIDLAEDFSNKEEIAVILGDNIFEDRVDRFDYKNGARIYLKEVPDAYRFGVAEIKNGKIIGIEEKPKEPKSDYAVTGLYFYDNTVFDRIKELKPSARGEFEVTDLNMSYVLDKKMDYRLLNGFWSDAGTKESLSRATRFLENLRKESSSV